MLKKSLLILGLLLFAWPTLAQDTSIELLFFYSPSCSHCKNLKAEISNLEKEYPQLKVTSYDVTEQDGNNLFLQLSNVYNRNINGVPVALINDKVFVGDANSTINEIEYQLEYCSVTDCQKPSEIISSWEADNEDVDPQKQKSMYILVAIGIIATFLVIIFLFNGRSNPKS